MAFATIATIASLGLQGLGTWLSARNQKREQAASDRNYASEQAYDEMMASRNPLETRGNRALIGEYDRSAKKQVEAARNVSAITGATPEYSLGVQEAVANGKANLLSGIAKEAATDEEAYLNAAEASRQRQYQENLQRSGQREQSYANMAANAAAGLGSILSGYTGNGNSGAAKAPAANNVNSKGITGQAVVKGGTVAQDNGTAARYVAPVVADTSKLKLLY